MIFLIVLRHCHTMQFFLQLATQFYSQEMLISEEWLVKCNEDAYLPILHLSRVELHCKLQEKLHRVTVPLHIPVHVCLLMTPI